ncbi:hypothetical protein [Streptomyces sp. NPDC058751]|uniref:hypothetical protein n=1 Tax=Streptomyces sp. NPDC058751 TaxID=3346623 RepID=UPI0036AC08A7
MDVMTALLTRRAPARLSGPAPGEQELRYLLKGAAAASGEAPHPWYWVLQDDGAAPAAPLRAGLVLAPDRTPHLSDGERTQRAYAALHALELLLHARGYASSWHSADHGELPAPSPLLPELAPGESLLGLLSVGRPETPQDPSRRPLADTSDLLSRNTPPASAGSAAQSPCGRLRPPLQPSSSGLAEADRWFVDGRKGSP